DLQDFRVFDWRMIISHPMAPAPVLWDLIHHGPMPASTQDIVRYLGTLGYPAVDAILKGDFQHFGAWTLDCLVISMAIELGLRSPTKGYEVVSNAAYAVIGGLDPWPSSPAAATHSPHMAGRMANLYETYAGSLATIQAWEHLRRLGAFIVLVEYYDKLDTPHRALATHILRVYRGTCTRPSGLSNYFQDPPP
ncbi:MAG: hypothetical protein GY772_19775, partial [bacterium]|nr:hypothetical protein [bacterium]